MSVSRTPWRLSSRRAQHFARLVEEHPQALEHHSSLGGVHNNLGMAYERLKRPEDALAAYRLAVERQRVAFEAAPQIDRYREFLSTHYANLARVQRESGQFTDAEDTAQRRKALGSYDSKSLLEDGSK